MSTIFTCKCGSILEYDDSKCDACGRHGCTDSKLACNGCERDLTDEDSKDPIGDDTHECANCARFNS